MGGYLLIAVEHQQDEFEAPVGQGQVPSEVQVLQEEQKREEPEPERQPERQEQQIEGRSGQQQDEGQRNVAANQVAGSGQANMGNFYQGHSGYGRGGRGQGGYGRVPQPVSHVQQVPYNNGGRRNI